MRFPAGRPSAFVVLLTLAAPASTGCGGDDTCVVHALSEARQKNLAALPRLGSVGTACPAVDGDGRFGVDVTLRGEGYALWPSEDVEYCGLVADPVVDLNGFAVASDAARVFPSPDVWCDDQAVVGDACPDAALAAAGFTCDRIEGPGPEPVADYSTLGLACVRTGIELRVDHETEVEFDRADVGRVSVVALLVGGASVLGLDAEGAPDRVGCSTDPYDRRASGMELMLREIGGISNWHAADTRMCLGTFSDTGQPAYRYPEGLDMDACFQRVDEASEGSRFLSDEIASAVISEDTGGRIPWRALRDAYERFGRADSEGQRHVVLVADGDVDAASAAAATATGDVAATAIAEAVDAAVTVHVVHFDRRERGEECTPETVHGPVDDFADAACATGGTYLYTDPTSLSAALIQLGRSIPGRYRVPLVSGALAELPRGSYRIAFVLGYEAEGSRTSYPFSFVSDVGWADTRALVRVGSD